MAEKAEIRRQKIRPPDSSTISIACARRVGVGSLKARSGGNWRKLAEIPEETIAQPFGAGGMGVAAMQ
jgi:hypothetical protein